MTTRPVVLTLSDFYLPGYKAGGPITTLANMVAQLSGDASFRIVTRDRDDGDAQAYAQASCAGWNSLAGAEVRYLAPGRYLGRDMQRLLADEDYDLLYLNSIFSYPFSIRPLLWRLRAGEQRPTIIAPRGELSPGALGIKSVRKRAFLAAARTCGLHRRVIWQASAAPECEEIQRWFGPKATVVVAPDLAAPPSAPLSDPAPKEPGRLRLVFLSRVSPKKNLHGALAMLPALKGRVELTIVGPLNEEAYWQQCQQLIRQLPPNVAVRHVGEVKPSEVNRVFHDHHLLFLPTLGENFCHVVLESLSAGCPVLITDRTPWRGLESVGAGWDLPLEQPRRFQDVLQQCIALDQRAYTAMRDRAREYAVRYHGKGDALTQNRRLLEMAYATRVTTRPSAGLSTRAAA